MIRYNKTLEEIIARVDESVPNWRSRAEKRTKKLKKQGYYKEASQIWSEVKPVFVKLQHRKCIFCEQQLEGSQAGYIQHDLEHFRPKGDVDLWPPTEGIYPFLTGKRHSPGYYLLAYRLGNYAAACKVCNTLFKLNYFPIAGERIQGKDNPEDYRDEDPHLIFPLEATDLDPKELITFVGYEALPKATEGRAYERARVTIDFLGLNRDWLHYSRSLSLIAVWEAWQNHNNGNPLSTQTLELFRSERAPHTNCVNAFIDLCETDRKVAEVLVPKFQAKIDEEIAEPENTKD